MSNHLLKTSGNELRIELFGVLNAASVRDVIAAVTSKLNGVTQCVVTTKGVSDCLEEARPELVKLQQLFGSNGRRTAWVDDRARFRGVALWVMHLAGDPNAKAVATPEMATKWLTSSELREEGAARRVVST